MRWRYLVLLPFAALYLVCLPQTVQSMDTGDIVAAGVRLWVAHPPGYPLLVWLLHGFLAIVPWGTAFARASFVCVAFMLGGLAFVLALCETWLAVGLITILATLPVVWTYAVLPDAFSLHALLISAVLFFALAPSVRHRALGVCVAFGLAAANHQTIVFLMPLVAYVVFEERSWRLRMIAIAAGASLSAGLYLSLLAFDTGAVESWGNLRGIGDVLRHFLRLDYGTFKLSGRDGSERTWLDTVGSFLQIGWSSILGTACSITLVMVQRKRLPRPWWVAMACLVLYLTVFFALVNLPAGDHYLGMLQRFFIFPVVMLAALGARCISLVALSRPSRVAALGAAAILCAANIASGASLLRLPHDTVIEDYTRNLLDTATAPGRPSFLLVDGDTKVYAARYVQAVDGERDVIVLGMGTLFDKAALSKIEQRRPGFHVAYKEVFDDRERGVFDRFIGPNVDRFDFTHTLTATPPHMRTVFYPLGRKVFSGSGVEFASPRPLRLSLPVGATEVGGYDETQALYTEYAQYYLAQGRDAYEHQQLLEAIGFFRAGLGVVPWCLPCLQNACGLEKTLGITEPSCADAGMER